MGRTHGAPSPPPPSPPALLAGCLGSATLRLTELLLAGRGGLKGTPLHEVLPDETCRRLGPVLRVLDISATEVGGAIPPALFEHCTGLVVFRAADNAELRGDLRGVGRLAGLEVLDVNDSGSLGQAAQAVPAGGEGGAGGAAGGSAGGSAAVQGRTGGDLLEEVALCTRLRHLNLQSTGFRGGELPAALWSLAELDVLHLCDLELDVAVTPAAHGLRRLCWIDLGGNTVTYVGTTKAETEVRDFVGGGRGRGQPAVREV